MDLDKLVVAARSRLRNTICNSVRRHTAEMKIKFGGIDGEPAKPQSVTMTIRDREHFYAVVTWCNKNIGKGKRFWTVRGKTLKYVDPSKKHYNPPAIKEWIIFIPGVDLAPMLAL